MMMMLEGPKPQAVGGTSFKNHVRVDAVRCVLDYTALGGYHIPLSAACVIVAIEDAHLFRHTMGEEALVHHGMTDWPRYVLVVRDAAICREFNSSAGINPTLRFLVAAKENGRMARYLAGTDNPIHDLLEELRYNPLTMMGAAVKEAKANFERLAEGLPK